YMLMSTAIEKGLYHPRCKDSHTTYFPGISSKGAAYTDKEKEQVRKDYEVEQKKTFAHRQAERFGRLALYSLDTDNKKMYVARKKQWENVVANGQKNGIIELNRKLEDSRKDFKFISDKTFERLTIEARKNGATIIRGTNEVEAHLDKMGAAASNIGDILMFRKEVCISEVIEETYHFKQNKMQMNNDKTEKLRIILNEIDTKQYILDNALKYKIPRNEIELTERQLKSYKKELENYMKGDR
ncbi:MAG: hypothetical protein PUD71_02415, partial [Lachnospiraceae bacterium]|nr:hypothetical protein [Lachnospiraceae bacterium]